MRIPPRKFQGNILMILSQTDWQIRTYIYTSWVQNGNAPIFAAIANQFKLSDDEAQQTLERLHEAHHIFLDPTTRKSVLQIPYPLLKLTTVSK